MTSTTSSQLVQLNVRSQLRLLAVAYFVLAKEIHCDAFPGEARPRDAAADTHKQAGRQGTALTRASSCSCHVGKRFRILATPKQGNKCMYSNTSGCVHMGLRLD